MGDEFTANMIINGIFLQKLRDKSEENKRMKVTQESMPRGLASLQIGGQMFVNLIYQKEEIEMINFNEELKYLRQSDRGLYAVVTELTQLSSWVDEAVEQGRLKDQQADDIITLTKSIQINLNASRKDLQATYKGIKNKNIPLLGEVK